MVILRISCVWGGKVKIVFGVLIILGSVLLMVFGVFIFLFCFAFVRRKTDCDNLDSPQNDFLRDYKETVRKGMEFIENQPKRQVSIKSYDGLTLVADYYKNGHSKKTIILFHGYRSSAKRDFSCAVEMYYKMGLNVLLVDQRAHGRSNGKLITFGVKERYDVKSWIKYVEDTFGQDTSIILDGLSMGATTVLLSAQLNLSKNVKCIIADCGFSSPAAIIKRVSQKVYHVNSELILKILDVFCRIIGGFSIYGVSTKQAMENNNIPIFICHGKADDFVPCEMSEEAFDAAVCEKQIHLCENAGHGMSFLYETEVISNKLKSFIECHI